MIFILVIVAVIYVFIQFWGLVIGAWLVRYSAKNKKRQARAVVIEESGDQDLESLLTGWDGENSLEVEEFDV